MKTAPFNSEQANSGRQVVYKSKNVKVITTDGDVAWCVFDFHHVTIRFHALSHPADPAPGHNPDCLDEWTVGTHEGKRLLVLEEINPSRPGKDDIEIWSAEQNEWAVGFGGASLRRTYRTKRLPGYFLPTKPVTRNLRPDEFPRDYLTMGSNNEPWLNTGASEEHIERGVSGGWRWSRSLDGPWNEFTTTEP
jgi:hypothetical protein